MSIAVLVQVYDEVRRLAVAGSAVAPGDFRLKKLVPPLEQAGAKAPVFARVAQAAQAVVDSSEKTASASLLELATLVNAILYTQGENGAAGELKPLETTDLGGAGGPTQASARMLKPLLEALTSTGSGRLELVRDAVKRGAFKDLRLVKPALDAVDDPYPEVADLIAQKVLPGYGPAILPELRAKLDVKGRGGHLHRLRLMHRLDPEGSRDVVRRALDEGSKEMRVAAIECLGTTGDDLTYLLEQAGSKARDVRAAALRALGAAGTSSAQVIGALKKAIDGPDIELIITRLKQSRLPEVRDYVLAQAERQFDEVLALKDAKKDAKKQGPAIARLQKLVHCLEGRTDAKAEAFLLRCFDEVPTLAAMKKANPSGQDFNELLAYVLSQGTPKMRRRLAAAHKTLSGDMLEPAFDAARETMTPAEFFKEFSPLLAALAPKRGGGGSKKAAEVERADALAAVLTSSAGSDYYGPGVGYAGYDDADDGDDDDDEEEGDEAGGGGPPRRELDPRWLDAAIDAGAVDVVCDLARPGHAKVNQFLSDRIAGAKPYDAHDLLQTMVRIGHPGVADAVIGVLKKHAKSSSSYGYYGYWYGRMIAELPRSAFPKLEAALPTLPEKMVDQLMESVLALKEKPE